MKIRKVCASISLRGARYWHSFAYDTPADQFGVVSYLIPETDLSGARDYFSIDMQSGRISVDLKNGRHLDYDSPLKSFSFNIEARDNYRPSVISKSILQYITYLSTISNAI